MSELRWRTIVSPLFAENAYVIYLAESSRCVVVDPGLDAQSLLEFIEAEGLQPEAILNTHGHADHIAGNYAMKQQWPDVPLVIGRGDAPKLTDPQANLSAPFGMELVSPPADQLLDEGDVFESAGIRWEILHTPGHCSGHIVFVCKQIQPWVVLGGDVLFREGVGRTDFPDGDPRALGASIREKLFTMPDETVILTGHGESTTIGHEKVHNPFIDLL